MEKKMETTTMGYIGIIRDMGCRIWGLPRDIGII